MRFGAAIGVALSLMLFATGGWYLYEFMRVTNQSVERLLDQDGKDPALTLSDSILLARFAMARIAFNACGLMVGLATGFLAVSLFLLGVEGSMDVQAQRDTFQISVARMSAGAFAILCSTAIVITCVMSKPTLRFGNDRVESVDPAVVAAP